MPKPRQDEMGCLIRFIPAALKTSKEVDTEVKDARKETLSGAEARSFYEDLLNEDINVQEGCEQNETKKKKKDNQICCKKNRIKSEKKISTNISTSDSEIEFMKSYSQKHAKLLSLSQNGELSQLRRLLENEPRLNLDHCDQFGWTPLMCATVAGHKQIVQYLLSKGANIYHKNSSGKSAFDLARATGAVRIENLFKVFKEPSEEMKKDADQSRTFYCEICKTNFSDMTEKKHSASTVHLFNLKLKPKPDPFLIPESNIGFRLMRSSGWDGETGLGPDGKGAKFPVKTILKTDRSCLGSQASQKKRAKITHFGPNDTDAVNIQHKHSTRVLSARASSRKERRRREQKEKRWEQNLRQYWDIDCNYVNLDNM